MKAKVLTVKGNIVTMKVDGVLKADEIVTIKTGEPRRLQQNNLYWAFLSWLIKVGGLKEHGHFSPEGLHQSVRSHFLDTKQLSKGIFKIVERGSTTDLNTKEFGEYIETVDKFVVDFFGIDTSPFWEIWELTYKNEDWKKEKI